MCQGTWVCLMADAPEEPSQEERKFPHGAHWEVCSGTWSKPLGKQLLLTRSSALETHHLSAPAKAPECGAMVAGPGAGCKQGAPPGTLKP